MNRVWSSQDTGECGSIHMDVSVFFQISLRRESLGWNKVRDGVHAVAQVWLDVRAVICGRLGKPILATSLDHQRQGA
jgi:hypothetical protein